MVSRLFSFDRPHVRGTELSPQAQAYALRCYVYRHTADHVPQWATKPRSNGAPYPVAFASDRDWLANTFFNVTSKGNPSGDCYSRPTWPHNPELRRNVGSAPLESR